MMLYDYFTKINSDTKRKAKAMMRLIDLLVFRHGRKWTIARCDTMNEMHGSMEWSDGW
jgi:hypothetical protein